MSVPESVTVPEAAVTSPLTLISLPGALILTPPAAFIDCRVGEPLTDINKAPVLPVVADMVALSLRRKLLAAEPMLPFVVLRVRVPGASKFDVVDVILPTLFRTSDVEAVRVPVPDGAMARLPVLLLSLMLPT